MFVKLIISILENPHTTNEKVNMTPTLAKNILSAQRPHDGGRYMELMAYKEVTKVKDKVK